MAKTTTTVTEIEYDADGKVVKEIKTVTESTDPPAFPFQPTMPFRPSTDQPYTVPGVLPKGPWPNTVWCQSGGGLVRGSVGAGVLINNKAINEPLDPDGLLMNQTRPTPYL